MAALDDIETPKMIYIEGAAPGTPPAGTVYIYAKADGFMYSKDDAGAETAMSAAAAGSVATDAIWDAAGDLVQGTGANTAAKLSAGTLGYHLRSGGAAAANVWAKVELDYVQITSPVTLTATTEGTAHTCITGTSQAYAAEPIIIDVFAPEVECENQLGAASVILLFDGATVLGRLGLVINPAAQVMRVPFFGSYRLTPTAATHQYIVKAYSTITGTGSFGAGAGGTGTVLPAFLRITRAL